MSHYKGQRSKFTLRMPSSLYRMIRKSAEAANCDINTYILNELQKELEKRTAGSQLDLFNDYTESNTLRKTGRKGGLARAANLTPERRSDIARKAAKARWKSLNPQEVIK